MYSYIYINRNGEHELVLSGIKFYEFFDCLEQKVDNIMLLRGAHLGNKSVHKFELVEGKEQMELLSQKMKNNQSNLGDFHFLDYSDSSAVEKLTPEEIKDILFLSHMWQPFDIPFFDTLQNRFAYLSHDDGWYCKLYIRSPNDLLDVIIKKVINYVRSELSSRVKRKSKKMFSERERVQFLKASRDYIPKINSQIKSKLCEKINYGLFVDLNNLQIMDNKVQIGTYVIGKFDNMDEMYNSINLHKDKSEDISRIFFDGREWSIN